MAAMIRYGFTAQPHVLLLQFLPEHAQVQGALAVLWVGAEEPRFHQVGDLPRLAKHQMMSKLK